MSESSNLTPTPDEHRDRLLDHALRELHGREVAPDLSARILAQPSAPARPLQRLGADQRVLQESPGRLWPSLALAAALLIAASTLIFPSVFSTREAARRTQTTSDLKQLELLRQSRSRDPSNQNVDFDSLLPLPTPQVLVDERKSGVELGKEGVEAPTSPAAGTPIAAAPAAATPSEFGIVVREMDRWAEGRTDYYFGDGKTAGNKKRATMLGDAVAPVPAPTDNYYFGKPFAGPAIIIQEEDEERLGVERDIADGVQEAHEVSLGYKVRPLDRTQLSIQPRDRYARIEENPFKAVSAANTDNRLSTFSIDVDTASYANVRQYLLGEQTLPPPDAVRIEELVNYFQYDYSPPTGDVPFAAHVETAACPWNAEHRLARVAIKGREMERTKRPKSNLVFLIDVSGSMDEPAKLPLLVEGMRMLTRELGENDRVSIVVYAGSEGLALPSTPGTDQPTILAALDKLSAGGSTAGGAGIALAYKIAKENFIAGATNRVILCTDGDFNVGVTSTADLERMAESQAKETGVFLTVLGFGRGNLNDEMMERIADKGNGNYHYVDGRNEARKVLVEEMTGTLVTIAKDVKIQVEFNPAQVAGYRLIGYENRVLAAEDFNDDKKDAGEIGAGHTVTALYEIIPAGQKVEAGEVDDLKYETPASSESESGEPASAERAPTEGSPNPSPELLTLKIRYKAPDGDKSTKLEFPITDNGQPFAKASQDFQFASGVASFGMLLRQSQFKGNATYAAVAEIAAAASKDRDPHGYRKEFVEMVAKAKELAGE